MYDDISILNHFLKVQSFIDEAIYNVPEMQRAALSVINEYDHLMSDSDSMCFLEEIILDKLFNDKKFCGETREQFRFLTGSLYAYDSDAKAYVHVYRSASANTMEKAIREYQKNY